MKWTSTGLALALAGVLAAGAAFAKIPPDIAAKIKASGQSMDPSVMRLYAPLHPKEPYANVTVERDLAYGEDPLQKLDVFQPPLVRKPRPVLIFVHGGGFVRGDKHPPGSPFTDNHVLWAAHNGMVGVNINYRLAPKDPWPAGAKDLASAIAWTRANIARYGGDPNRIFLWGHSAGANHVADYVAHPEVRGPEFAAVKGAILLSPNYAAAPTGANAYYGTDVPLQASSDQIARLAGAGAPLFIGYAEYDPDGMQAFAVAARKGLCAAKRCPGFIYLKGHNHYTEGAAVGTSDTSLTGPMLKWMTSRP